MFVFLSFFNQLKEFHLNVHIAVDELINIYDMQNRGGGKNAIWFMAL